ncbi:MAG: class I SAM-dependent methyltransferase [Gemmatimonadales bacterium]
MESIYQSGEYLERNKGWHTEDSAWKAQQIARAIERYQVAHNRVCDVGCGAGEVMGQLAERYPASEFVGFDLSPQAYALARDRQAGNCSFVLGSALGESGFDLALAIDVFEHVEDCYDFLRRMRGIATWKIFHIPLDMSVLAVAINNPMWARKEVGHLHYFSKETALATLTDCGYEIVGYQFTNSQSLNWKNLFVGGRTARKLAKLLVLGVPRLVVSTISPALSSRFLGGLSLLVVAR